MKTVGELLRASRKEAKLSLVDISKRTKIQVEYLKLIENNNFKSLPAATFVKGFIQNFAKAVGANPETMLAIFRRDYAQDKKGKIVPRSLSQPIERRISFNPKTTSTIIFSIISAIIIGLFAYQINNFYKSPEISITKPQEGDKLTSPLEISGSTNTDATISINNQQIPLGEKGEFKTQIQLSPGEHIITITAASRDGKTTTKQRSVTVSN